MLSGKTDQEKLADLSKRNYKAQAIWFLNSFWNDFAQPEAENLWTWVNLWQTLDEKKADGSELDELLAHRFLEQIHSTMTVKQMRDMLRDAGVEKVKLIPLVHYLVAKYKADWHKLVNAIQGDNVELEKAQKMLQQVQTLFKEAEVRAKEASTRESASRAAEDELQKAVKELESQEQAFKKKTTELEKKTEEGGVVQKNKAKAELAAHLAEDPLPLRKAKITTEAAHKKAEKAMAEAVVAREAADKSVDDARKQVEDTETYLKEVSSKTGSAKGALWWVDRELQEARKYMPLKKGGVAK